MNDADLRANLLRRYFEGRCTPEEREQVLGWLAESGPMDTPAPGTFSHVDRKALRAQVLTGAKSRGDRTGGTWRGTGWKIAAALTMMAVVGHFAGDSLLRVADRGLQTLVPPERRALTTAAARRLIVTLEDGTKISLNAGSTLRYPTAFARTFREVELEGQAYFEVAPDSRRPFTVKTPATSTTVLGTRFDVRAYPGERTTVAVREGKVRFSAARAEDDALYLTAGTSGEYRPESKALAFATVRAGDISAWKDGTLAFHDRPLSEVAAEIERWYGIPVRIHAPEAAGRLFSGIYPHPDLNALAADLSRALGIRHRYETGALVFE